MIVLLNSDSVCPAALVSVPGPFIVVPFSTNVVVAVLKAVVKFAVTVIRLSVPGPPRDPALWFSVPPLIVHVRPAPSVTVPLFVKLGVVPLCVSVRFAALRSIVPLFT